MTLAPTPSEEQVANPGLAPLPASTLPADPTATTPADPDESKQAQDEGAAKQAKAVRETLASLGIGTIATPKATDVSRIVIPIPAAACAPTGTVVVVTAAPTAAGTLSPRPVVHPRSTEPETPQMRGPPAPVDTPASQIATAGSGAAAPGGASSEQDWAIHAEEIDFALADGEIVIPGDCDDYVAPELASAAARGPPVA